MIALRPALIALPLLALAGCGGDTARTLGFTRDAPDEFQVTTRAPLSVPPRLGELPVPTPGAPRPQDNRDPAAILAPGATAAAPSSAERALVAQAGGPVGGDIRRQVDAETLRLDRPPQGTVDRLMNWFNTPPTPGIMVDPTRESQRLRENAALGRETTEGDTPIVQPRSETFFQRWLGWAGLGG
ncbi:DUF3035 domain-containing protein [Roseomonas sp. AR75]|jgi:hypothetical protein|uniref:DUF3035 domain-containing protein n=1 Tax=Roseomonas sp. AR75 TaxID=2562311 RepID=UPI0010C0B29D|nr:DUF3035 domain-containing protein [Roseomonas sp. AR75]